MTKKIWLFHQEADNQFNISEIHAFQNEVDLLSKFPQSVYTTFRTYDHQFGKSRCFRLDEHFKRLIQSCELQGTKFCLSIPIVKRGLHQILASEEKMTGEIRVKLVYDASQPFDLYILMDKLETPSPALFNTGVKAFLCHHIRENPQAKTLKFISFQHEFATQISSFENEVLLVDQEDSILEGLSSNFFAVRENIVYTAGENILNGITRQLVLDLIRENEFQLILAPIKVETLCEIDECFITSTSRGVLPVVQIEDIAIGNGKPGKVTQLLMHQYKESLEQELILI